MNSVSSEYLERKNTMKMALIAFAFVVAFAAPVMAQTFDNPYATNTPGMR